MSIIEPAPRPPGQDPLHVSIRNAYRRISEHMEADGVPQGWPDMAPPAISGVTDCVIQYVDLSGSTKLALGMEPLRYAALVTALCREVALVVRQHGGHPLKYVGDAVVSVFTGYSLNAADAALGSAVSTMRMIYHAFGPATNIRAEVHVGMSYGKVVAVPQGGGVDILGAPVNLAAKLLALRRQVVMDGPFRNRLHPECRDIRKVDGTDWQYGGDIYEYVGRFHS